MLYYGVDGFSPAELWLSRSVFQLSSLDFTAASRMTSDTCSAFSPSKPRVFTLF